MSSKPQSPDARSFLSLAAADGVGGSRTIDAAARDEALGFVLQQIAATVLGRTLTFRFGDDFELSCEVVGRRLMRLVEPLPDIVDSERATLALDADAAGDPDWLAAVASVLGAACERPGTVSVSARPIDGADPARRGASAEQIGDALAFYRASPGADGATADADAWLARFLERAGDDILCAERVSAQNIEPLCGEPEDLDRLSLRIGSLMQDVADRDGRLARILGSRGLLVVGRHDGDEPQVMIAAVDGVFMVALARANTGSHLSGLWNSALAG